MEIQKWIDELGQFLSTYEIPGLAAAVVKEDRVVLAEGFGLNSVDEQKPVTSATLFHMASVSKPFSAIAIMQLVERGLLSLDARIVDVLPYFKMEDPRIQDITILQMLNHISGMPDVMDYEWGCEDAGEDALEKYVRSLGNEKLMYEPGTDFAYSNIAFEILGDVIAKISGLSFEEYMKVYIFQPAGMQSSTFLRAEVPPDKGVSPHVRLFANEIAPVYPYNRAHAPSSTVHMNAEDACRWMIINLNRGTLDVQRILAAESYDILWKPHWPVDPQRQVGLSWFLSEHRGLGTVGHGGGDTGFSSYLLMIPEREVGVTVMANLESAPMERLAKRLLDLLLGFEVAPLRKPAIYKVAGAYHQGGLEPARETLQECLAAPDAYDLSSEPFLSLGDGLNDAGRPQQALEILELGLELDPESAALHAGMAWVYRGLGEVQKSQSCMQRALALDPHDRTVRFIQHLMS